MAKVIVERPRRGRSWAKAAKPGRTRVVLDDDGAPTAARAPVGRPARTKELNENLSPLKRFLASQVGRPWDKVYADISEHLKPTSTVQQHVRDHLEDFVAIKCRMRDGVLHYVARFGGEEKLGAYGPHFFVHPRTGLLKRNPLRTRR
ncbi:MAG TPA: hypothetical protein VG943_11700 [Caulobacterales bacterium]|nr:hypothetical protein [Caulobacterales bacterium]